MVNTGAAEIYAKYDQEFGAPTPMIREMVNDDIAIYTAEWVLEAMQIAVERNVRNWKYVRGILERCKSKNTRPSLNRLEKRSQGNSKRTKQDANAIIDQVLGV